MGCDSNEIFILNLNKTESIYTLNSH